MNQKFMRKGVGLGCSLLCLALTCCKSTPTITPSIEVARLQRCNNSATWSAAGMEVKAYSDVPFGIDGDGKVIRVDFENHTLRFENGRTYLDRKVRAKIPPSPVALRVVYAGHMLSITADGKPLLNTTIKK